ncbi:hypothetical protein LSA36186_25910 [Lachnoanaerobaculum sp. JCM 36186]|nr:hypothetical protein LSA36186_25910 [Lachnoanaerobaculum sp. JCM 36186]
MATPSQITIPGRDEDVVIRPTRPLATPSIATSSNTSRGGSGSSGSGSTSVRPGQVSVNNKVTSKNAIEEPVILIDTPTPGKNPQPQKVTPVPSSTRVALAVPKTEDRKDVRGYVFILMSSIAAAMALAFKKKEER